MMHFFSKILDLIFPPSEDTALARSLTEEALASLLYPTQGPEPWITALFPYREARIRALIKSIKYRADDALLPALGRTAAEEILEIISEKQALAGWEKPILVPIPASRERMRLRGYNQTEKISAHLMSHLNTSVRYMPKLLARSDRKSQALLGYAERKKNIEGAFFVPRPELVEGQGACIILFDDVVESGATLTDARRALLSAGARDVIAVAVAR